MIEQLKQKINEEILKLPKINQEAINSIDWGGISEEIGKKYLLTENEIHDFQTETGLVLIGLVGLDMYALNIEKNIGVSQEESEKIAKEAFDRIFKPIADIIEQDVKNKIKTQIPKWDQSVNFIISGGDYSNFIEK